MITVHNVHYQLHYKRIYNQPKNMTLDDVMQQLQLLGHEEIKNIFLKHGAREPFFGVKVGDLKTILKKAKTNYPLALELYNTGNTDAMYLAGLMTDPEKMSRIDLINWAETAYWYMISEYTVAWVASESLYATELALEWIESDKEPVAAAGWSTLANFVALKNDNAIDYQLFSSLLDRVADTIHSEKNRVRYAMNSFMISVGGYCLHLSEKAIKTASSVGKVNVEMGGTACKVPVAVEYIDKMHKRGMIGKKKKTVRC